jgi:putative transposase
MALLVCVGVDEEGFREVVAVEVAGSQKGVAYASLLRRLVDRGLRGVRLAVSDDRSRRHKGSGGRRAAGSRVAEVRGAFRARRALSSVPASEMGEVAEDLKAVFKVRREKTARALVEEFVEPHSERFPNTVAVFEAGIGDALTCRHYPGSHHAKLCARRRCWSDCSRRSRGGRGWWGCSPTRRALAPWPQR